MAVQSERSRLRTALHGRADTLTHCPLCGERARFLHGRADNGHEVAGWLYENPILVCPRAPSGLLVAVNGSLVQVVVIDGRKARARTPEQPGSLDAELDGAEPSVLSTGP